MGFRIGDKVIVGNEEGIVVFLYDDGCLVKHKENQCYGSDYSHIGYDCDGTNSYWWYDNEDIRLLSPRIENVE